MGCDEEDVQGKEPNSYGLWYITICRYLAEWGFWARERRATALQLTISGFYGRKTKT